jgi:hypothetical protein
MGFIGANCFPNRRLNVRNFHYPVENKCPEICNSTIFVTTLNFGVSVGNPFIDRVIFQNCIRRFVARKDAVAQQ